ncbi:hypothetical protein [Stutzerimonas xanthomarina]|uniref:hypothetical protein n=1 Tax=Stutzerimonas xanthomarina TaxID=271420 RepID=UPI00190B5CC2|nr:hypothetical protein [Stutzerimonas xanthomarina]MBK3848105.1 hypothetical protein [Stutzerimonas xanthomarina]
MPTLYNDAAIGDPNDDYVGQKIIGWQKGNRQDAIDLAKFYARLGDTRKSLIWAERARETGIARLSLQTGMKFFDAAPDIAVCYLIEAFRGLQSEAIAPLYKLLIEHSPETLRLSRKFHHETVEHLRELQERIDGEELPTIVLTGTRPVLFQKNPGPATYDNAQWGGGSLFVVSWQGVQFAVTALHVIENLEAERREFRLLIPGTETTLEMYGGITPSKTPKNERDELEDIYAWHIRGVSDSHEDPGWWSWRLDKWSKPASELAEGQHLIAAGYPDVEERYDHENFKVIPIASILNGTLSRDTGVEGIYAMDVDKVEHPMNLMSGGPVFAKLDGFFHYVGMILRGNDAVRKIYFLDVKYVIDLLDRHNRGGR